MAEGWISLNRSLFDNELWTSEPFSRGQAWVDLLLLANHKDSYFYKRGNKITVKRGELGRSCVELSDRWKWSRTKVNKFLKDLEKEQQIKVVKTSITQVVTIVNYDKFQAKGQQTGQQKSSESAAKVQQKDTYNNDNNVKNDNKVKEVVPPTQKVLDFNESEHEFVLVEGFKKFINFLDETKHVKNIPRQITISEYKKICDKYTKDKLWEKITGLDNWFDNPNVATKKKKDKKSVYHLMVNTWLINGY